MISLYPKQTALLLTEAQEILFGGGAGGSKSFAIRAISLIYAIDVPGIQIAIFRRTYKETLGTFVYCSGGFLELGKDLIDNKKMKFNKSENVFEFVNGSRIYLNHCQHASDVYGYQGMEFHMLCIDEATLWEPKMIKFLRSRVRLGGLKVPEAYKNRLVKIIYTANPGNIGHNYFKKNFVDHGPNKIWKAPLEDGGMTRCFIPSRLEDNPALTQNDPDYAQRLHGLGDPETVRAMLEGDWTITGTTAFPSWRNSVHIVEDFILPKTWKLYRAFDWGWSKPYFIVYFAVCNGDDYIDNNGERQYLPKGSIIVFDEIYGADKDEKGLQHSPKQIAEAVKQKDNLWKTRGYKIRDGAADSAIYSSDRGDSIAKQMMIEGVTWTPANKRPGSRIQGWQLLNQYLYEGLKNPPESETIKFFSSCGFISKQIPNLQRDAKNNDDIDTNQNDHGADALRYGIMQAKTEVGTIAVTGY